MTLLRFLLICLLIGPSVSAEPRFVRIGKNTFDTAVTHYSNGKVSVDLVAVVHLGTKDYYAALNQRFKSYDVVLYELIAQPPGDIHREEFYEMVGMKAPPSNPVPIKGSNDNPTTAFQRELCEKLGLEFQLDHIDYEAPNFRHADLNPRQLDKLLRGRKQKDEQVLLRLFKSLQNPNVNWIQLIGLYSATPTPQTRKRLRGFLAQVLLNPKAFDQALQGDEAEIYLERRNAKAARVLKQVLAEKKKHVAIFYGAAHMPDMDRRMRQDFQLKRGSQEWLSAWEL